MATRARPATRSTSRPKRRPAARRKPAARRGGSRIRWDRVGRIALTLVLATVLYSYLNPTINFVETYTATTAAKAKFHEMLRENKRLHNRIQTAGDPMVVNRKARAQGLVAEGETPIVVHDLGG